MTAKTLKNLSAYKKAIGAKQTIRALEKEIVLKVFLGNDADEHVILPIVKLCESKKVEIDKSFTMVELGKLCEIQVGAAAIAIIK